MANTQDSKLRLAPQPTEGVPPAASAFDTYLRLRPGTAASPEAQRVDDDSIEGSSQQREPLVGQMSTGPFDLALPVNPEELPYLLAYATQKLDASTITAGVEQQIIGPTRTGTTLGYFALEIDRGDGFPLAFVDGRVTGIGLNIARGSLMAATVGVNFTGFTQFADATVVAQTGAGTPVIRGLAGNPDEGGLDYLAAADERRIYVKVTDVTGLPSTCVGTVKQGLAASYGAQTTTFTLGSFSQAFNSNVAIATARQNRMGDPGQPIEIRFPTGATPAVNDEFYFELGRPTWTPSFSTAPTLAEVHTNILFDGNRVGLESYQLQVNVPYGERDSPGRRFKAENFRSGEFSSSVTIGRSGLTDYRLMQALLNQKVFELEAEMVSKSTFAASHRYELRWVMPKVIGYGQLPDVGADSFEEQVVGTGHVTTGHAEGFNDSIQFIARNSIADLSA